MAGITACILALPVAFALGWLRRRQGHEADVGRWYIAAFVALYFGSAALLALYAFNIV